MGSPEQQPITTRSDSMTNRYIPTRPGSRWHKLTAIAPGHPYMHASSGQMRERWVYRCDCGNEVLWQPSTVRANTRRGWCSCAVCYRAHVAAERGVPYENRPLSPTLATRVVEPRARRGGESLNDYLATIKKPSEPLCKGCERPLAQCFDPYCGVPAASDEDKARADEAMRKLHARIDGWAPYRED